VGLFTCNNNLFVRQWHEVSRSKSGFGLTTKHDAKQSTFRWFPYNKGGSFRKWYGNSENLVDFADNGNNVRNYRDSKGQSKSLPGELHYFSPSITWSFVSSSYFGVRYSKPGAIFDVGGSSVFPEEGDIFWLTGFMCSKLSTQFLKIVNPTLNYQVGNVASLPIITPNKQKTTITAKQLIALAEQDWDSYETSWDFRDLPLLRQAHRRETLAATTTALRQHWQAMTQKMQSLEEENNRIFIEAYGLQDELTPDVPLKEITLTCNPHYRYKGNLSDAQREARLRTDTIKEFISYAVGCMFGRYSPDKPGLVLANQGETVEDYLAVIAGSAGDDTLRQA